MTTTTLLEISAWTGVLAAVLLVYRLLSTWHLTSRLTKGVAGTLLAVIVGQAYGSTATLRADVQGLPHDAVVVIFVCRLLVVALCLAWPWRE